MLSSSNDLLCTSEMNITRRAFILLVGAAGLGAAPLLRGRTAKPRGGFYRIEPEHAARCRPSDIRFCARARFDAADAAVAAASRRGFSCFVIRSTS